MRVGDTIGDWTVVALDPPKHVVCVCACGTRRSVAVFKLRYGRSKSCGCKMMSATVWGLHHGRALYDRRPVFLDRSSAIERVSKVK